MFLRRLTGFRIFSRKHGRNSKGTLERSSNTNIREMSSVGTSLPTNFHAFSIIHFQKRGRPPKIVIATLDPNKFAEKEQQTLEIGNLDRFRPFISLHKEWKPVMAPLLCYYSTDTTVSISPDTKAFLYYFTSPERPRIAGELRLRVVSSDDPASFKNGSDLLLPNGQAWSRPLYSLSKYYLPLYEKLREDQLVPDDLDTVLSTLLSQRPKYRRTQLLYTLNDPFIIDFSRVESTFFAITEQGMERLRFRNPFSDFRNSPDVTPYTGAYIQITFFLDTPILIILMNL